MGFFIFKIKVCCKMFVSWITLLNKVLYLLTIEQPFKFINVYL